MARRLIACRRGFGEVARRPELTSALIDEIIATDGLAPRDPELPAGLAAELATDPDHTVRRAVAGHRSLPVEYLVALLSDEDEWTAHAAACSARLPVEQMERLLALAGL
jgi:hypothetical protein